MVGRQPLRSDNRAAVWSLRAAVYVVVMIAATVAVTQFAASAAIQDEGRSKYAEYQTTRDAQDILRIAEATGDIGDTLLYYQHEQSSGTPTGWHDADDAPSGDYYTQLPSEHPLSEIISNFTTGDVFRYNINISYRTASGDIATRRLVYQGTPSQSAVTASKIVFLNDDDVILDASGDPVGTGGDGCTLGDISDSGDQCPNTSGDETYFAPDAFPDDGRYNIVQIEITLW